MEDGRKGIAGAGNMKMAKKKCLGLHHGLAMDWVMLNVCYCISLSLGILIHEMGMLMAPTWYDDQMS